MPPKQIAVIIVSLALIFWIIPSSSFLSGLTENMAPGVVPAHRWAANLDSPDKDLVRESLSFLTTRADPVAVDRAILLLKHPDDYVWLNAAYYIGACKRQEATPYLIKALRHTARKSLDENVSRLESITGKHFGRDFEAWRSWWQNGHPNEVIAWDTGLGFAPNWKVEKKL
ncbi:MAG: HEAT repeat domain-containing protein [Verrucomicrobiaceae bacterium]|nr:HEAT repeat domain-containing protein [Verrucomicrobiaceae bacterium]